MTKDKLDPKLKEVIKALRTPKTIARLMQVLGVSRKTVYRYLDKVEKAGYLVVHSGRSRPVIYQLRGRLPKTGT